MSSPNSAQMAGLLFAFTIISTLFWIGAGFLPFTAQVSGWFRSRLESDAPVAALGGKAAANNMTPFQVVVFSIASIVMGSIILANVGPAIGADVSGSGVPATALLWGIFLGAAAVVGGVILAIVARTRVREHSSVLVPLAVFIAFVGVAATVTGLVGLVGAAR